MGFNVTNFTTNSPMFFSHKHTPDYLVLEAVAAAMSIPPAIKPLYSEANVYKPEGYSEKNIKVKINDDDKNITDKYGRFINGYESSLEWYYLVEVAIKKYLSLNNKHSISLDVNNNLNRNALLPLLKEELFDTARKKFYETIEEIKIPLEHRLISVDNYDITITNFLLVFYYNTAYKGMFMDGGVTCNIPYNYFREDVSINEETSNLKDSLKGVLALKLDNGFPAQWVKPFKEMLAAHKLGKSNLLKQLEKEQSNVLMNLIHLQFKVILLAYNKKAKSALQDKNLVEDIQKLSKDEWENIADSLVENVKESSRIAAPWQKKKSILGIIDTLYFGSEQGQVRYISDHNHIVPLYCYGIGVYDFDMKKIQTLIKIANDEAEKQVTDFFTKQ